MSNSPPPLPSINILAFGWWFPPRESPVDFHGLRSVTTNGYTLLQTSEGTLRVHEFGGLTATQHVACTRARHAIPDGMYGLYSSGVTNPFGPADGAFIDLITSHAGDADLIVIGHGMGAGLTRASLLAEALKGRVIVTSWMRLSEAISRRYASLGVPCVLRSKLTSYILRHRLSRPLPRGSCGHSTIPHLTLPG